MTKFTLRIDDDALIDRFDALARDHGLTRTALITRLMRDALDAGYVPRRPGEGLRAITGSGAEVSLERGERYVRSGRAGLLTDAQEAAFERACALAAPERGSQWVEARKSLEEAGFKVFKM